MTSPSGRTVNYHLPYALGGSHSFEYFNYNLLTPELAKRFDSHVPRHLGLGDGAALFYNWPVRVAAGETLTSRFQLIPDDGQSPAGMPLAFALGKPSDGEHRAGVALPRVSNDQAKASLPVNQPPGHFGL